MKAIQTLVLLAALAAGNFVLIARQPTNAADKGIAPEAPTTNAAAVVPNNAATAAPLPAFPAKEQPPTPPPTAAPGAPQPIPQPLPPDPAAQTNAPPAAGDHMPAPATTPDQVPDTSVANSPEASGNGSDGLRLNFRNAPLDRVLNYMSEAAGFVIVLEARPRGTVDVWSATPVTREEAVNLLNQALKKNGYAAIRNGRTLTVVPRDEAKTRDIPVFVGSDPAAIPKTDEIVTQIIPVRFVEVAQLVKDLQPLVSLQTTITANESGNEIVITDTQANIRKVAEIIKAIDAGAEDVTVVRVFRLNYADPTELADLLMNLFPDDSRSGGSSSPVQFGGFGGMRNFFRGGGPGGGNRSSTTGNQNQRIKKRSRVLAVPDPRTSSVAVSAAQDLMDQIDGVVAELDSNPAKVKQVKVFKIENADAQQVLEVLQDTFQNTGQNSRNAANQNSALQNRSSQQSTGQGNSALRTGGSSRSGGMGSGSFNR